MPSAREEAKRRRKREAEEAQRRQQIDAEAQKAMDIEEAERRRIEEAEAARRAEFRERTSNMVAVGEGLSVWYIDRTEVTVQAFKQFKPGYEPPELASDPQMPATRVSYREAADYCRSVGKRLPTDAEWLSACLGDSGSLYGYGNSFDQTRIHAGRPWYAGPAIVGTGGETSDGATGMAGNVWEWTNGWYDRAETRRSILGGAWPDGSDRARCTAADWQMPDRRSAYVGFRCATDPLE